MPTPPRRPRPESHGRPARQGRPERQGRPQAEGRPERQGRPQAAGRPERQGRPTGEGRPQRPAASQSSDRRGGGPARQGRPQRLDREGRPDRQGRPERPGRPEQPGRTDDRSRPERQGRPEQPGRTDDRSRPERQGRTDDRSRPERTGRAGDHGRPTAPTSARDDDRPRRPRVQEPELPADISPRDLDRGARAELRGLPETLADRVATHLVAAGQALDDDPALARRHAWYARSLAPRLAIVREAAGITAYADGDFTAALAELRAVRRITGDPSHLPLLADCERGLGRPDRALALGRDPDVKKLDPAARVELAIVLSGARRDRGEYDAAVVGLQGPALEDRQVQPWTARLWYAYADALLDAGRVDEAQRWFESVVDVDDEDETDAATRLEQLRER